MIEKVKAYEETPSGYKHPENLLQDKINELVDAVNELHEEAESNARTRADHEHKIEELQKEREEIKEWIGIVSDLRSRVPVVENRVSILEEHAHPTAKTPADPYEEQRKWIGCLCRMKPYDWGLVWDYKILERINENNPDLPFVATDGDRYKVCELIKPDDQIIYKGGDNE